MTQPPVPDQALSGAPPQAKAPDGLATAALVVGIIAVLGGAVPVLGLLLGATAIILGALALRRKRSRGKSLTGLILGAVAAATSIIVTVLLIAFGGNLLNALAGTDNWEFTESHEFTVEEVEPPVAMESFAAEQPQSQADGQEAVTESEPEPEVAERPDAQGLEANIPWDAHGTADAPLSTNAGTPEDPHRLGTRVIAEHFEIVLNSFSDNATEQLLELEPANTDPGDTHRFVAANLTLKSISGKPLFGYKQRIELQTTAIRYHAFNSNVVPPAPKLFAKGQQVTGNFTGYAAFLVDNSHGSKFIRYHDPKLPDSNGYIALD
ncbi:hypothetical protein JOF48_003754 [Arthrobacter stackebrandtii]|uniref:DUF4190 domain-containing protein n=1 Tax=Arthrobacter stackebrandtii TaxID=272161 RepID=A0ABS4Z1Q0_9MICC|nr:DUF4190 domain-containing protein [Arthrobacter stackebrandtii]MBP2414955.1 hypothetical protein [Arthrobacter stackebrandtii]PYH00885.1 hypothetical protein CVV67_07990 [Arthrobacter stackebrandtii]